MRLIANDLERKLSAQIHQAISVELAQRQGRPAYAVPDGQALPAGAHRLYDAGGYVLHSLPAQDEQLLSELRSQALSDLAAGHQAVRLYMSSLELKDPWLLMPLKHACHVAAMFAGHLQHAHLVRRPTPSELEQLGAIATRLRQAKAQGQAIVRLRLLTPQLGCSALLCAAQDVKLLGSVLQTSFCGASLEAEPSEHMIEAMFELSAELACAPA